jgi:hypothetical protein
MSSPFAELAQYERGTCRPWRLEHFAYPRPPRAIPRGCEELVKGDYLPRSRRTTAKNPVDSFIFESYPSDRNLVGEFERCCRRYCTGRECGGSPQLLVFDPDEEVPNF